VAKGVHPVDEYVLARSRVGDPGSMPVTATSPTTATAPEAPLEDDLFAGVRDLAAR
jgi:hypothetical protein